MRRSRRVYPRSRRGRRRPVCAARLCDQWSPDKFAAFRIPAESLDRVNLVCEQQDLTRSQFLRRSVVELLDQHPLDPDEPSELKLT